MDSTPDPSRIQEIHELMVALGRIEMLLEDGAAQPDQRAQLEQRQMQLRQAVDRLTD